MLSTEQSTPLRLLQTLVWKLMKLLLQRGDWDQAKGQQIVARTL